MIYNQPLGGPAAIDREIPLGAALRASMVGSLNIEPVSRFMLTTASNVTRVVNKHGISTKHLTTNGQISIGATAGMASLIPHSLGWTIAIRLEVTALGVRQIFVGDNNAAGAGNSFYIEFTAANVWRFEVATTVPNTKVITGGTATLGHHDILVAFAPGVGTSFYVDGQLIGSVSFTDTLAAGTALRVGSAGLTTTLGFQGSISFCHFFAGDLSSQRAAIFANPYQMFLDDEDNDELIYSTVVEGGITSATGASAGSSSTSSVSRTLVGVSGNSAGSGNTGATVVSVTQTSGQSAGSSTASSNSVVISTTTANSVSTATANSTGITIWQVSGSSGGISSAAGTGEDANPQGGVVSASGNSVGTSISLAIASAFSQAVANAVANSSASALGALVAVSIGGSTSISNTGATTNSVLGAFGVAQGTSSAQSIVVIIQQAVGMSISASLVDSVTSAIKAAIGTSNGVATVQGVTQGGIHYTGVGDKFSITIVLSPYKIEDNTPRYKIS